MKFCGILLGGVVGWLAVFSLGAGETGRGLEHFSAYDPSGYKFFKGELALPIPAALDQGEAGTAGTPGKVFPFRDRTVSGVASVTMQLVASDYDFAALRTASEPVTAEFTGSRLVGFSGHSGSMAVLWLWLDRNLLVKVTLPATAVGTDALIREFVRCADRADCRYLVAIGKLYSMIDKKRYAALYDLVENERKSWRRQDDWTAVQATEKALKLKHNCLGAYYYRALAYTELKEYEKAAADYKRILEIEPATPWAYLRMMELVLLSGHDDQFAVWLEQLGKKWPDDRELAPEWQIIRDGLCCIAVRLRHPSAEREEARLTATLKAHPGVQVPSDWNLHLLAERLPAVRDYVAALATEWPVAHP